MAKSTKPKKHEKPIAEVTQDANSENANDDKKNATNNNNNDEAENTTNTTNNKENKRKRVRGKRKKAQVPDLFANAVAPIAQIIPIAANTTDANDTSNNNNDSTVTNDRKTKDKDKKRKRESTDKEDDDEDNDSNDASEQRENKNDDAADGVDSDPEVEGAEKQPKDEKYYKSRTDSTIFVGNVPLKATTKQLAREFRQYGPVESVRLRSVPFARGGSKRKIRLLHKEFAEKRDSCNAYVVFKEEAAAKRALAHNGKVFMNKHLRVDLASHDTQFNHKNTVFVGNLSLDIEDEALWELFQEVGQVNAVRVLRDRETNIGKGIAFVEFKDREAAQNALYLNGKLLDERNIRVTRCAKPGQAKKNPKMAKLAAGNAKKQAAYGKQQNQKKQEQEQEQQGDKPAFPWQGVTATPVKKPKKKNIKDKKEKKPKHAVRKAAKAAAAAAAASARNSNKTE